MIYFGEGITDIHVHHDGGRHTMANIPYGQGARIDFAMGHMWNLADTTTGDVQCLAQIKVAQDAASTLDHEQETLLMKIAEAWSGDSWKALGLDDHEGRAPKHRAETCRAVLGKHIPILHMDRPLLFDKDPSVPGRAHERCGCEAQDWRRR